MTPQCKEQTSVETKSRDRVEFDQSDRAAPITKIDIAPVAAPELSARDIAAWSRIQRQSRSMNGPLFGPEFTKLVAGIRHDVEVAVLRQGDEPVGFFPFHRDRHNVARPVGMVLSDFHGVVAGDDVQFDPRQLLRDCGLTAWHFNHLLAEQLPFVPYHWSLSPSPYVDLSAGFDAYAQERRASGSDTIKQVLRKIRKIEREVGPLRFVPFETESRLFDKLVEWKLQHFRRIKSVNHLAERWKIDLLKDITRTQGKSFSGMLSALYARDHVIALHLGVVANGVFHCWFPTYDEAFAKYSPGLIFWVRLAQEAESLGIQRIDLGKGPERYKQSLMSGADLVAEGSLDLRRVRGLARKTVHNARQLVRSSPLQRPIQRVVRGIRGFLKYR